MNSCIMKYSFLLFIFLWVSMPLAFSQKFVALVDKKEVGLNDVFQVSFRLENAQATKITPPSFESFQIVGGPNQSTSMQIINGQVSQSVTYSFYLRPTTEGTFSIGSAQVIVEGKTLKTNEISIKVVKGTPASTPQRNNNVVGGGTGNSQQATPSEGTNQKALMDQLKQNIFVRTLVDKTNVYQGEQIVLTYKLYTRAQFSNVNLSESPTYKSFWVEEIDTGEAQYKMEVYKGQEYRTAVIQKVILFPQRPGKLRIDPIKLESLVKVRSTRGRRPQSIFDAFFETYQDVPFEFSSKPVTINVKALPSEGQPANFNGAVGTYTLKATLDKNETQTDEAVTMSIKISGKGNIKTLENPKLDFPPDFDVFDPKISDQVSKKGSVVRGNKAFDYLIIPRNPGEFRLPSVSFSYFDLSKKRYVTLNSEEFLLAVEGEPRDMGASAPLVTNKEDIKLIGEDIRHIKADETTIREKGYSFLNSIPFLALYILPFLMFGFLFFMRKKQEVAASDVAGTRSKKATRVAIKRLSQAQKDLSQGNEKAFYKEVSQAVWGYLGDKLALGTSGLSRDQVREALNERGVTDELIQRLVKWLNNAEMALFAPSAAQGGMEGTYQEAKELITTIESELRHTA